jgi:hypothetical protein
MDDMVIGENKTMTFVDDEAGGGGEGNKFDTWLKKTNETERG